MTETQFSNIYTMHQGQDENHSLLSWVLDHYRDASWHRFNQPYYRAKEPRYRKLIDLFPPSANRILDAGIYTGEIMNYLLHHPNYQEVIGVDVKINHMLLDLHPKQHIEIMDLQSLKFSDKSFDLVICSQVLEHIKSWDGVLKAISELRRVCRGTLIISVPLQERIPLQSGHHHVFDIDLINSLFPDADIETLDYDDINLYNFPAHVFITESHEHTV